MTGLTDLIDWIVSPEERSSRIWKTITFFYFTNMSIPLFLCFLIALLFGWYSIPTYLQILLVLGGGISFVLMVSSFARYKKGIKRLRDLYFDFTDNMDEDFSKCSDKTRRSLLEFQALFVRLCPRRQRKD